VAQHSGTQLQKRGGECKQQQKAQSFCKNTQKNTEKAIIKQCFESQIFANKEIGKRPNGMP
jgi:hypothetical protein